MLASLLVALAGPCLPPAGAAERLHLRFDGLEVPVDLQQLADWTRRRTRPSALLAGDPPGDRGDLALWLGLLDGRSRQDLTRLLRAPLLRSRSFGEQLLTSWAGRRVLEEVGALLTDGSGRSSAPLLQDTLRQLLARQEEVSTLDLLRALPTDDLHLQLDTLLEQADLWRTQLRDQQRAMRHLRRLALPQRRTLPPVFGDQPQVRRTTVWLPVPHRPDPLPLEIWRGSATAPAGPWVVLMPGLGGNSEQLSWLAASLADRGWPAVVLQHPGSDFGAMQALLAGEQPPPGAETLPERLADLRAVLRAEQQGPLPPLGEGVVLMGHSLGALTALLASTPSIEPGLQRRCQVALRRLPLTNLSRLLQCQLADRLAPASAPSSVLAEQPLRGVVVLNGFGSLLWPERHLQGVPVPLLMVGGSLDLVTPPVGEQLELFLPVGHPRSRLVVVDGGSHFSPVRVSGRGEVLFRLGEELVGVEPRRVQDLILRLTLDFLEGLRGPDLLQPQHRLQEGVGAYVLDAAAAERWRHGLRP